MNEKQIQILQTLIASLKEVRLSKNDGQFYYEKQKIKERFDTLECSTIKDDFLKILEKIRKID